MALRVPFFNRLTVFSNAARTPSHAWIGILLSLSWLAFVVAAMRPVSYEDTAPLPHKARNIMLAIDVSGSMKEQDFDLDGRPLTRLQMVKRVAGDFIRTRSEDNIGLVIFGSEAYLYAPLSFDKKTLQSLFGEVNIGIAGDQTAMGDAVVKAVQGVRMAPEDSRIVILLSDGFSNAGVVNVDEAVRVAQKQNVKVYTVGIGSSKDLVGSLFGALGVSPSLDLDEETLTYIAKSTGGQYFRAKTTKELTDVYRAIDKLERTDAKEMTVRPRTELFYIPLLISMAFLLAAFILKRRLS